MSEKSDLVVLKDWVAVLVVLIMVVVFGGLIGYVSRGNKEDSEWKKKYESSETLVKFLIQREDEIKKEYEAKLRGMERVEPGVSKTRWGSKSVLEVVQPGVSKGRSMKEAKEVKIEHYYPLPMYQAVVVPGHAPPYGVYPYLPTYHIRTYSPTIMPARIVTPTQP